MNEFEINIIPFNIIQEQTEVFFSLEKKTDYQPVYKDNLPRNFPEDVKKNVEKFAWWSNTQQGGDLSIAVNLLENRRFSKHFLNKVLFDHFDKQGVLTNRNFINDTEIYLEDNSSLFTEHKKYNSFILKIDNNDIVRGNSLLVSYAGDSFILNKNLEALSLDTSFLGKVKYQERILKFDLLKENEKQDKENIYPILNRDIRLALNIKFDRNYSENRYKKYYDQISSFFNAYLKNIDIDGFIKIPESGFYKVHEAKLNHSTEESNLLLFGKNKTHFTPYVGLKEYGPIQPPAEKPIRFIFIFHQDDKGDANKVYSYLKKGYKSFSGLESFVKIKFDIDTEKSIRFKEHNPFEEIKSALEKTKFDNDTTYVAIYISRINKNSDDEEDDSVYYKLKELLLKYKIVSQVIIKENISNPSFNYFLPNIAIALLAKLGGVPWRLSRPIKNDLIIGIGADHSRGTKNKFIGNAFCFQNDGKFKGFNAFEKKDSEALADSLKSAIEGYIKENKGPERLVIHYYKNMGRKEEEPIRSVLNNLNLSIPYIIATINESDDYLLFENSFDGKMPQSGTFIQTKWNEFILCNNTRYSNNTGTRIEGFPFPIKIKLKASNNEKITNINMITELIDQIYQFSRMYWKSVRQRSMPVTIEYSEMVAKMIANFDNKDLDSFSRNSLWFL